MWLHQVTGLPVDPPIMASVIHVIRTLTGAIRTPSGVRRTFSGAASYRGRSGSYYGRGTASASRSGQAIRAGECLVTKEGMTHNILPARPEHPNSLMMMVSF